MKILWIVNTIFPAPSKALNLPVPVVGGWMYGLAERISKVQDVRLSVATVYNGKELKQFEIDDILYYLIPSKLTESYNEELENYWVRISTEITPDVVHIHGTEYTHGLACMRKLPDLRYVVSIQGLVSVCARFYFAGISGRKILQNITLRDIIKGDNLFQARRKFTKRGLFEKEYIERTPAVIGRTSWDYAHTKAINPNVSYHFCNESLRDSFYTAPKWSIEHCDKYSIFISQAAYPIKGLHQVLQAAATLKNQVPALKIRVGGAHITANTSLSQKFKLSGYGKYLLSLISRYELQGVVKFLGPLSEDQMIAEYLRANVFICPSSIENSPNSVGEAQLLGVPVIAAFAGGIPDMVKNRETGFLYRFEEIEMLTELIRQVFENGDLNNEISSKAKEIAHVRHDRARIVETSIGIYRKIYE